MNVHDVLHSMPAVGNWRKLAYANGSNRNIIAVLENNFTEACRITKHAAKLFKGATDIESAENVWDFLKQNVTYKADGSRSQDIRLPNRLLSGGTGDCKSFALFAASVLANLGLPVGFRYVSFRKSKVPTHVYTIAEDDDGNEIIIDAVWKYFNAEHSYTSKQDRFMEVAVMGSIAEDMTVQKAAAIITRLREKLINLPLQSGERTTIRNHIDRLVEWVQSQKGVGLFNAVKTVYLAIPRNAFRALVALNVRALAKHLNMAVAKNSGAVRSKWESLGGNYADLLSSINAGKNKQPIFGEGGKWDGTTTTTAPLFQDDFVNSMANTSQAVKDYIMAHLESDAAIKANIANTKTAIAQKNFVLANALHAVLVKYVNTKGVYGIGEPATASVTALLAQAAVVLAAMTPIIKTIVPEAANDIDGFIDQVKAAGGSWNPPADGSVVGDDQSKSFSFSSIPIWGWGLGAAAVGYFLFVK